MISSMVTVGLVVTLIVSIGLPLACIIYCIKKGGTQETPMMILMGLAAYMVIDFLPGLLFSIFPEDALNNLPNILYLLVPSVLVAVLDSGIRTLTVGLAGKRGFGLYKGLALGAGFAAGNVLMRASLYVQTLRTIGSINDGTFVQAMIEQGASEAEVLAYQDSIIAMNPGYWFATALNNVMLVLLNIALVLIIIKFFLDGKKLIGALVVAGFRLLYEFVLRLATTSSTDNVDEVISGTSIVLISVISAAVLAGSVFVIIKLMKTLPKEAKTTLAGPLGMAKNRKQEEEKKQSKKAWSEVSKLNTRNIDKD